MRIFVLFLLAAIFLQAAHGQPLAEAELAGAELENARIAILQMQDAGFNTSRVQDLLAVAAQIYEGQLALEVKNETAVYADVIAKARSIQSIRDLALKTQDDLLSLEKAITRAGEASDVSGARQLYEAAILDFRSERYESAQEKIDEGFLKVSEAEASTSYSRILLSATKTIAKRLLEAWKQVALSIALVALAAMLSYEHASIFVLNHKVKLLEIEKSTLNGLIQKAQNDYFQRNALSESDYHIEVTRYGEMVRDINRQIPILREEIEKRRGWLKRKIKSLFSHPEKDNNLQNLGI